MDVEETQKSNGMVPIHIRGSSDLPSRFYRVDGLMRLAKTRHGYNWIFPKAHVALSPLLIQVSSAALSVVEEEHFWQTAQHGPLDVPVLTGTQFGLQGLDRLKGESPGMIGRIGVSTLSGCIGGFSIRIRRGEKFERIKFW